jgi:hypothetical protein
VDTIRELPKELNMHTIAKCLAVAVAKLFPAGDAIRDGLSEGVQGGGGS